MCISLTERQNRKFNYLNPNHILQTFKERGKSLFGKDNVKEMLSETMNHILNPNRCVIVPDERKNENKSNYIALFLTDYGKLVAIPLYIDDVHMNIMTLKDVQKDDNANWHIQKYNEIGGTRGLGTLPLLYKPNNS